VSNRSPDPAGALLSVNRNQTVVATKITAGNGSAAAYPDNQSNGVSKAIGTPVAPLGGTPGATPSNAWERVSRTS
jgi:hypothetical protein